MVFFLEIVKIIVVSSYDRLERGYEDWRDKYKYGYRWMTETFFSGVKKVFGETSRANTVEGVFQEVKMKVYLL